jgi:hypothetical protein
VYSGGNEHGDFNASVALREDGVHPTTLEFEGEEEEGAEEQKLRYVEYCVIFSRYIRREEGSTYRMR